MRLWATCHRKVLVLADFRKLDKLLGKTSILGTSVSGMLIQTPELGTFKAAADVPNGCFHLYMFDI